MRTEVFLPDSIVRHNLPEVDTEGAKFSVQMGSFHADSFRQLTDFTAAEYELLLQIGSLEMLSSFAQRHREKVLLHEWLVGR